MRCVTSVKNCRQPCREAATVEERDYTPDMRDPALRAFIVRDGGFTLLTVAVWVLLLRSNSGIALHIIAALMTVTVGYLAHEWGHLIGAWTRHSAVVIPKWTSPFLFNYDVSRNTNRQFTAMAMGGFVASALFVVAVAILMPMHLLASKIAIALTVIGVIATFILEVPTAWRVYRGAPLPQQGPAFVSDKP